MDFNKAYLAGRIVRDLRAFQGGSTSGCSGDLAVNERRGAEHQVLYVAFKCFGKPAETMLAYLKKGSGVFLEGKLVIEEWNDKATGVKKSRAVILVFHWTFTDSKAQDTIDATCPMPAAAEPQPDMPF